MLKVYGTPASRAGRTLWLCRELGLQYEHDPVHFADGSARTPEYLAVNPAGKVPAIDDDGFKLSESMAINIYLAKKHGGELAPKTLEEEASMLQWSFWAVAELEGPLLTVFFQRAQLPPGSDTEKYIRQRSPKDPATEQAAVKAADQPLSLLDKHLAAREYLLGPSFTLADLNVASVVGLGAVVKLDLSAYPHVHAWFGRCMARPAARPKKS